jgi:hypothetical protein
MSSAANRLRPMPVGSRGNLLRLLLVVALGAALFVAGCGGDDDDGGDAPPAPEALEGEEAAQAIGDAAAKTTEYQGGVDATLDLAVTGAPQGDTSLGLGATLDAGTETGQLTFEADGGSFTVQLVDGVAYLTSDDQAFLDALPEGAEWVEADPSQLEEVGLNTTFDEGGLTPQLYLALGATDVVAGDTSEVNGVPVQSYSFGIDEAAAVEEAPEEAKQQVEDAITLEGEETSIDGGAAIDGEGYMRQMNVTGSVSDPLIGDVDVTFDVEYLDFGVEVPSEEPDPATVVPFDEAAGATTAIAGLLSG